MKKLFFSRPPPLSHTVAFSFFPWYNKNMKKKEKQQFKKFPYKLSPIMWILAFGVIALCLAGIVISVYRIVKFGLAQTTDYLQSPLIIAVSLFGIAVVVGILCKSEYAVGKDTFYTRFGFIKSSFPIKEVTSMILDTDEKKLTVYFGEQFMVLSMNPSWNDDFIQAMREANPEIEFSFTLAENKPKNDAEK